MSARLGVCALASGSGFKWHDAQRVLNRASPSCATTGWPQATLGPVRPGRQVRVDPGYGHIFDHFYVEFEYENGARISSMCRQQDGTETRVGENVVGTKGTSNPSEAQITGANLSIDGGWTAADGRFEPPT